MKPAIGNEVKSLDEYTGPGGKVYVANVTMQNHKLNFLLPGGRKAVSLDVGMGRQIYVAEMSTPEIDAMVHQLGPYGLVESGQVPRKQKVTYIFRVGGPVSSAEMQKVIDQNRGILRDEGKDRREKAAIAANVAMNTDETPLRNMTMDVEEIDPGDLGNDSDHVGEGFSIDNVAAASNANKRPRNKRVARPPAP